MASMNNTEGNISLEINLLNNEHLDISLVRDNSENWIPFELTLNVAGDVYEYTQSHGAMFSMLELCNFIQGAQNITIAKDRGDSFSKLEFCSSEGYFDILLNDSLDNNLISIEIWLNIGSITNGASFGYDKGFRFEVVLEYFSQFFYLLKKQMDELISNNNFSYLE